MREAGLNLGAVGQRLGVPLQDVVDSSRETLATGQGLV